LGRVGATKARFDFRPVLPRLLETSQAEFAKWKYAAHASLLLGDIGAALVAMRLDPTPAIADRIYARADANTTLPVRGLIGGRAEGGHGGLHDRRLPHGRHDGGTALASAVRSSGRASARGLGRDGRRSVVDAGPLWPPIALPRTGAWLRRQHDRVVARLGMA